MLFARPKLPPAVVLLLAFVPLDGAPTPAQAPQQAAAPPTQSARLEVLALDKKHQPVPDLKPEDFHLRLRKQEVKIDSAEFGTSGRLHFTLLFDFSGSSNQSSKFRSAFPAASDFLRRVWREGDSALVVAFNNRPYAVANPALHLDAALADVDSLARLVPKGPTALYDTICSVVADRNSALLAPRVLLVFSDFDDDASHRTEEEGLDCARRGRVQINTFVLVDLRPDNKRTARHGQSVAADLSQQTGGVQSLPESASDLSNSLTELSGFVRSRYEITFREPPLSPASRPGAVDIQTSRRGVKLYFAKTEQQP